MSDIVNAITALEKRTVAFDEAIAKAGGLVLFAATMGVTCRQAYSWRTYGYVPLERAIAIEAIFEVDHKRLLTPDVIGSPSDGWKAFPDKLD